MAGYIFWGIIILIGVIFLYIKHRDRKRELNRRANTPKFLLDLESKIKTFRPIREYREERLYQAELVWYLKSQYPDIKIEETRDRSRPDIVIEDIAIEIKWPTDMAALGTLPDKINKYLPKWDYLFIVLFNIKLSENPEKSISFYESKKTEILENTIESKREKIFFIEIYS